LFIRHLSYKQPALFVRNDPMLFGIHHLSYAFTAAMSARNEPKLFCWYTPSSRL
jgi:hypothetical protein